MFLKSKNFTNPIILVLNYYPGQLIIKFLKILALMGYVDTSYVADTITENSTLDKSVGNYLICYVDTTETYYTIQNFNKLV